MAKFSVGGMVKYTVPLLGEAANHQQRVWLLGETKYDEGYGMPLCI